MLHGLECPPRSAGGWKSVAGWLSHMENESDEWSRGVGVLTLDLGDWAEENFGSCDLKDARRTRRAVTVARQMAEHPDGSGPAQTERWADLKAMSRLFHAEEVTFAAVATPHWQRTRSLARGTVLLIGDTMETDFGILRAVEGLGPTGDGSGLGFFRHSSMRVDAASGEIIGLAGQELFYHQPAPEGENSYQALQHPRESEVWGRVVDQVGVPAAGVRFIHVFDRGADNLDVFCHCRQQRTDWVIRAAQLHRMVEVTDAESEVQRLSLRGVLDRQPLCGEYDLSVRATQKHSARIARLQVRFARVAIRRPKRRTNDQRHIDFQELAQSVVEVCEVSPPQGVEPLHGFVKRGCCGPHCP